jgi:energy-coupling factor transporter ATP-binding protein EcfA2
MRIPTDNEQMSLKNYFDSSYGTSFPLSNFFVDNFLSFPSFHLFTEQNFRKGIIDHVAEIPGYDLIFKSTGDKKKKESLTAVTFLNEKERVMIDVSESNSSTDNDTFFVKIAYDPFGDFNLQELISQINQPKYRVKKKGNISLIKATQYGLETVEFDIKSDVRSVEHCYGSEFVPVHNHIVESLNKPKSKGIILLHGEPGTGKSHYLKHLSTLIKDKKVLWLPQTSADSLCNPDFVTFLMENMNSILVIEDGERVIKDREGFEGSANAVSNLLNLTDGILSDCLNIQVIATFNTDIQNIDKALLRKGRLIVDYEFRKLSVPNTNKLFQYLGINHVSDKELTLADIYNHNQLDLSNHKRKPKIGFRK